MTSQSVPSRMLKWSEGSGSAEEPGSHLSWRTRIRREPILTLAFSVIHDMLTLDTEMDDDPRNVQRLRADLARKSGPPPYCTVRRSCLWHQGGPGHCERSPQAVAQDRTDLNEESGAPPLDGTWRSGRRTLHELDLFLRSVWLECCGHLSHFDVGGVVYSMMVPKPGDDFHFQPMDEREEQWRHMGAAVGSAIKPATWFEHQYDYGTTTELDLRHVNEFEGLAQALSPSQPRHGRKIVVLARNHPLQSCRQCGRPAQWRLVPETYEDEEDEWDDEDELFYREDDESLDWDWSRNRDGAPDPNTYCDECAPVSGAFTALPNSPRKGADCFDNVWSWRTWPLDDEE